LSRHSVGKHRLQVAQIDHLVQAFAEKVIDRGAAFKNSQKTGSEYLFESFDHPDSDDQHSGGLWVFCRRNLLNWILINASLLMFDDLDIFGFFYEFVIKFKSIKILRFSACIPA
jgi:hypothetical protein